jgi:hypothetical protein
MSVESHCDDDDDDFCCGKLLTRPPELSDNPASRGIWKRLGGMDEGMRIMRILHRPIRM